jgi:methionine-R-sulfoxide reductase
MDTVGFIQPTEELRATLGEGQYRVLVEANTEYPYANAYWNNHEKGIYVDVIDGTPLFSSDDKYDSGTGWPSFWAPLDKTRLLFIEDDSFGMKRVEVRSASSGGHLGHLFDDGPSPTRERYCMNSAARRFISVDKLAVEGFGALLLRFNK